MDDGIDADSAVLADVHGRNLAALRDGCDRNAEFCATCGEIPLRRPSSR